VFNRENAVGIILLGLCAVTAGILLYYIGTGTRPNLDFGPVGSAIGLVLFVGLLLFGILRTPFVRRLMGRDDTPSGQQWPNPGTGQKSLWDRLRGR
jgi:hypothetical protein